MDKVRNIIQQKFDSLSNPISTIMTRGGGVEPPPLVNLDLQPSPASSTIETTTKDKVEPPFHKWVEDDREVASPATYGLVEQYNELPRKYAKRIISSKQKGIDRMYGIRYDITTGKWMIGNTTVSVEGKDLVINGVLYNGTSGLYDLLVMNDPDRSLITQADEENYENILRTTHVTHRFYEPSEKVLGTRSKKYTHVIKPLLASKRIVDEQPSSSKRWKTSDVRPISDTVARTSELRIPSSSNSETSDVSTAPIEYVYWNDVSELIKTLEVLWKKRLTGHTGYDNEIMGIVNALYDEGYIEEPPDDFLHKNPTETN